QFCTHPNPLSFFVFSLVYIPKKDIYFISESEDDICFKHKKGMVDHASIKPAKKSKSMSIHHGFRMTGASTTFGDEPNYCNNCNIMNL
ncbi:hypothetical protein, partial [Anoxybacillus flavithermus]|uniref:hypothetical protein n=2 Tax=Anoxybacillus flavithermus TaxID=33934 RepID=UPI0019D664E3